MLGRRKAARGDVVWYLSVVSIYTHIPYCTSSSCSLLSYESTRPTRWLKTCMADIMLRTLYTARSLNHCQMPDILTRRLRLRLLLDDLVHDKRTPDGDGVDAVRDVPPRPDEGFAPPRRYLAEHV